MHQGQYIGNYELVSFIGKGGMGEVWMGYDQRYGRQVAIKGLHHHLINDPEVIARFRQEAQTLEMLEHPSIVGFFEFVEDHRGLYLVLEYVDGIPLDDYIEKESGPIPEETALPMFRQILKGVDFAHRQGIIHRDIKPSNFLVDRRGQVRILDFGIAKYLEDDKKMTRTGTRIGTVYFMSPEQVAGKPVDQRSDIYSLGVTFFQMLTGQPPYPAEYSEYQVLTEIVQHPLPRARTIYPAVSDRLQKILDRATAKSPESRFRSCAQFLAALESEAELPPVPGNEPNPPKPRKKRRWGRVLAWLIPTGAAITVLLLGYTQNWAGIATRWYTPREVAEKFFAGVEAQDLDATRKWVTDDCQSAVEFYLDFGYDPIKYEITSEDIFSEIAIVTFTKESSRNKKEEVKLVQRDGSWKVACDKENIMDREQSIEPLESQFE
ncbi:MAG: protein kinase [Bacteroidota bacterium]